MKIGIELEFWVVDDQGSLCGGESLVEASDRVYPEFVSPLVEIQTDPHENEATLRRELQRTLQEVLQVAEESGKQLVPLGTPLTLSSSPAKGERGRLFERLYGQGVTSAKNCAGTHVHFDRQATRRQLNLLTALDPALALVASSSYYCGERTVNCSRAQAYRRTCGDDFLPFCDLWPYTDTVAEWESRVDAAYELFQTLAVERGVDPDRIREEFSPEDTVLNPVRLRDETPTVEWRAPDSTLPSQVVDLAFDVRRLVAQTAEKPLVTVDDIYATGVGPTAIRIPEFETLSSLSDEAIRSGLESDRVRTYLANLGFDLQAYDPLAARMNGPSTLGEPMAREFRLESAANLRSDVASLTEDPGKYWRRTLANRVDA